MTDGSQKTVPRILLIGPVAPPIGGMTVQLEQIVGALQKEGFNVRILATNPQIGALGRIPKLRGILSLPLYLWRLIGGILRADVVHVLGTSYLYYYLRVAPALWLARLFRKRAVLNYHGGQAALFFAKAPKRIAKIARMASVITVPSAFLARVFEAYGLPTQTVKNVVDLNPYKARPLEAPFGPRFLVCRNLEPIYDVERALLAFQIVAAQWPEATLTVAGVGSERDRLSALAAAIAPGRITFVGKVMNAAMPDLYASHDLMWNPTTADNQPLTLIEALATGLLVVSTDAGGIPDLVGHEREALLVPVGNAEALAAAALRLRQDQVLCARLREQGYAKAAEFHWDAVRPALLQSYGALDSANWPEPKSS